VGITAYNEEKIIGRLLDRIVHQQLATVTISEIIVVISGCTDGTERIVRQAMAKEPRIKLLVQEKREGKASAINWFLRETTQAICVLCSGDLLPELDVVEKLVRPLADPEVGMTSCRPVPVNDKATFMGFAAHLLWDLHHQINLNGFKAGEMTAFRKIFTRIPNHTAVDEASVEPVVRGQGYRVVYVPDAIVQNKGPETVSDFLRQRRRIYAGHLDLAQSVGYSVSTMNGLKILRLLLGELDFRPKPFLWTWLVVLLEVYGRLLGRRDFKNKRDHSVWEIADTTKDMRPTAPERTPQR
jgi:cellulose synthase/poly-beta-1,6-N-acetylglucosamine synthase-like glycosyltransferase